MSGTSHFNGRRSRRAGREYAVPRPNTITQSTANTEPDLLPDADITDGLAPGQPLQVLAVPSVPDADERPVNVTNLKCIGSYNWQDSPHPTIIVPGAPRLWRNRPLPFYVPPDEGFQIFDPNGYYMGSTASSPLIPIFRAIEAVSEDNADTTMDWPAVDAVADRSTLRKLLRWSYHSDPDSSPEAHGPRSRRQDAFRIDLQLGGAKTVLMQRWDTRTCQYLHPSMAGHRLNFERAATAPVHGCEPGSDHSRIVQYDLEGLRMVVRFEVDAYTDDSYVTDTNTAEYVAGLLNGLSFVSQTAGLQRTETTPHVNPNSLHPKQDIDPVVTVIHGGIQIPQSSILEITTRSRKSAQKHSWHETYTQLFLSQTPQHILAVHERGTFETVTKRPLNSSQFERIAEEANMQRHLRQLVYVLKQIQRLVRAHGGRGRLSLVCRGGQLELFERSAGNDAGCLPDSELARFGI